MDQVAQIREKLDIVSFIAEFLPLKRAGRNFNTPCPFHTEKTPSFVVSPERQIWHCFGCQKGGDIYTFLMEYERLEFIEALRILAKKTGIELVQSSADKTITSQKERLYVINRLAAEFYHFVLTKHLAGKKALDYLQNTRLVNDGLIKTFSIGYAPKTGNVLSEYLMKKKNHPKEDLINAGLSYSRAGRLVDFFTNRIMFPLSDHRGNIIGFSGRIFGDETAVAKYINTRDTIIYHKGTVFFGLDNAKEEIKKKDKAIIVEGEFDVISSLQHGIKNVIAIKGTALTEAQISLLSRYTNKVALCFDEDKAGKEAIKRSLPILEKKGMVTTVVVIGSGKDADESLKSDPYAFKKAVESDIGVYDYLLETTVNEYDTKSADGKRKIAEVLLPFFANIENEIVKEHYIRRLSSELDASHESIARQLEKIEKKEGTSVQAVPQQLSKRSRQEVLEEYVIALIVQHENPKDLLVSSNNDLSSITFESPAYKKILDSLDEYFKKSQTFDSKLFAKNLSQELVSAFDTCLLLPLSRFETKTLYEKEIKKTLKELRNVGIRSKIKIISEKIKEIEKTGKLDDVEGLEEELVRYTNLLRNTESV